MKFSKTLTAALASCLLCATPVLAAPVTIDFNSLEHGRIVNTQYSGVTISADNDGGGPDLAVAFNTNTAEDQTSDDDLLKPWDAGNIPANTDLGNILIIQENNDVTNGIANDPDDEGSRPAGSIFFDFAFEVDSFGFDLIDVEGPAEYGTDKGYFATFYVNDTVLGSVGFGDFVTFGSGFYDPSVVFGNNSANRIAPITATTLGIDYFDLVEINFGGSAGIDNIVYTEASTTTTNVVPIPAAAWLFASALGLFGYLGKRKASA